VTKFLFLQDKTIIRALLKIDPKHFKVKT